MPAANSIQPLITGNQPLSFIWLQYIYIYRWRYSGYTSMPLAIPFSFSVCSFSVHPSIIIFAHFYYRERFHCSYRVRSVASLDPRWWSGSWIMTFCVIWNYRNSHRINRVHGFFFSSVCSTCIPPSKMSDSICFYVFDFVHYCKWDISEPEKSAIEIDGFMRCKQQRFIYLFAFFFFFSSFQHLAATDREYRPSWSGQFFVDYMIKADTKNAKANCEWKKKGNPQEKTNLFKRLRLNGAVKERVRFAYVLRKNRLAVDFAAPWRLFGMSDSPKT